MNQHLTALTIGGFRGLREVKLADLRTVNLLVGGTNSGKTTVLEALLLASQPLDPLVWTRVANLREPSPFAAMGSSLSDRLPVLFPSLHGEHDQIRLRLEGRFPISEISATMERVQGLRPSPAIDEDDEDEHEGGHGTETDAKPELIAWVERSGIIVSVDLLWAPQSQVSLFDEPEPREKQRIFVWEGEPLRRRDQPRPRTNIRILTPYEHWLRNPVAQRFSESVLDGNEGAVVDLLRRIEPRIRGMRLIQKHREPVLFLEDCDAGYLPISAYGDGIRRILQIALAVHRARSGILLIDEIESGLHVSMIGSVFRWLREACDRLSVQLFATTHSLEALDAILDADSTPDIEDTVAYQISRTNTGVNVKRFGEQLLRNIRFEGGLDIR